jgi:coenzyme F420 hydrogenase subunit beta
MSMSSQPPSDKFQRAVEKVVENDNCSGCGACALISPRVSMNLSPKGYMRPVVQPGNESAVAESALFKRVCPGVTVDSRAAKGPSSHPIFGRYWSVWEAWAADPTVRFEGSSAGVTTALAQLVVSSGGTTVGAAASRSQPTRTVPVTLTTKEEALAAAGSRYAPVATAANAGGLTESDAFVGKPCEVAAMHALHASRANDEGPILLSFFCAGTPSQHATDELASVRLGVASSEISTLDYRGNGWPGEFTVVSHDGRRQALSYQESWGQILGKALQWRCKICPDGTGQLADITVGDFWESDASGYPRFDAETAGRSVVICRTKRGHDFLLKAVQTSSVEVRPLAIESLDSVQPLQVDRRATMAGRVVGTRAAGRAVPRFRGFGVTRLGLNYPKRNIRAGVGAFLRVLGRRK